MSKRSDKAAVHVVGGRLARLNDIFLSRARGRKDQIRSTLLYCFLSGGSSVLCTLQRFSNAAQRYLEMGSVTAGAKGREKGIRLQTANSRVTRASSCTARTMSSVCGVILEVAICA